MSEREEIEVYCTWQRERLTTSSARCPLCGDFPIACDWRYTRADGQVWLCELCWERVFGEGDE